jgi:LacI family transcriptional regulator
MAEPNPEDAGRRGSRVGPRRPPGLSDVAARAGVSPSLVSRILSDDGNLRVRDETRQRVLATAAEMRYVPHHLARNLRASRAGALGLVVNDVTNPIYGEIIRGAQRALSSAGSVLLLVDAEAVTDEAALMQIAGGGRVDGLLWQMAGHAELDSKVRVAARYVPVVLVNSRAESDISGVHLDDESATRLALRHLLDLGHERIGFVAGLRASDVSERRREAYRATLAEAGIKPRANWVYEGGWDPQSGHRATAAILRARPTVTALLVTNAIVATGVVTAVNEAGLRVPEDVSLVALHDLWFVERLTPPLTVVRLPLLEMGQRAAELLLSRPQHDDPQNVALTEPAPELVVRGSTMPPAS